ncbi:MAG: PilN domain-containing protein [Candidatus Aminicenantia bacterium]
MIKINLLRAERKEERPIITVKPERKEKVQTSLFFLLLILTAVVILLLHLQITRSIETERRLLEEMEMRKKELAGVLADIEKYNAQRKAFEEKIKVIEALKEKQKVPVRLLDELSKKIPDGLWLRRLSFSEGKLTFSGRAFSNNIIADFISELESTGLFKEVMLKDSTMSTTSQGGGVFDFTIESKFSLEKR